VPGCVQKKGKNISPHLQLLLFLLKGLLPTFSTVVDPAVLGDRALGAPNHPVPNGDGGISHAAVAQRCAMAQHHSSAIPKAL